MSGVIVFHIRNVLALDGFAGNQGRLVGDLLRFGDGGLNLGDVVAVDLLNVPVESVPLVGNRVQARELGDLAAGLMVVQIREDDEVAALNLAAAMAASQMMPSSSSPSPTMAYT